MRTPTFARAAVAAALVAGFVSALAPAHAASPPWMDATQPPATRAQELLAQMTSAEKIDMMHGSSSCEGYGACVDANTRLGIPQLRLQDGPAGVADGVTGVTQLPAPVAGAATWDTSLMKQYGQVIGGETWAKGANVALGPTINIVRDPRWGRAFESLQRGPVPHRPARPPRTSRASRARARSTRSSTTRSTTRRPTATPPRTTRRSPRAPSRRSTCPRSRRPIQQGGAESVMCSYAEVNGTFACENADLLQHRSSQDQCGFHRVRHLRLGRDALHRRLREQRPRHGDAGSDLLRRPR